ncbi:MAG: hypothetical protein ABL966_05130, partial [Acidimicrobiales bacterium]
VVLLVALGAIGGCGGSDDDDARTTTTVDPDATTPSFVGDGSAFCDAMLGVGQIGSSADAAPAEVLADNEELLALLDDAQANTPTDAPPDFDALLDDYRAASQAIAVAGGDVEAAFATLEQESPEVFARLSSSTSHEAGFTFLVERCGITTP